MKIATIVVLAVIFMALFTFVIMLITGKLTSISSSVVSIFIGSLKMLVGG